MKGRLKVKIYMVKSSTRPLLVCLATVVVFVGQHYRNLVKFQALDCCFVHSRRLE
jgi:hypothetical protein